jgi:hypothetical protein
MHVRVALTDKSGSARAFLDGYTSLSITPRLNGFAEVKMDLPRGLGLGSELQVGTRALKVFSHDALLFFGKVWEPLTLSSGGHKVVARDPLAEFLERRARIKVDYTSQDAGLIAFARLAAQNAKRNTYLRAGTRQASADRVRTILPGALEKDFIEEMSDAVDGFYYQAVPVDGVPGVMADLNIRYPDAGTSLPDCLFAFGDDTLDTLADYEIVTTLPRNRQVTASSSGTGGRIAEAAEDVNSIEEYGLFEQEVTFSDVTLTALLTQHSTANVRPTPPFTISATPGPNAPVLFEDFNVGDFVRLQIRDDGLDLLTWARVSEATLTVNQEGNARTTGISFEVLVGDTHTEPAHRLYQRQQDDARRRLEALERRQQNVTQTAAASPGEPSAGGGSGGSSPSEPAPAPAPPPSTPGDPPTIFVLAEGQNYMDGGVLRRGVLVGVSVDTKGLPGEVAIEVGGTSASLGGSGQVFITLGPGSYTANASVVTSAGRAFGSAGATVPAVTAS